MNRKRKAERYAQALQRHRSRLLHIGVTQWIQVHICMLCIYTLKEELNGEGMILYFVNFSLLLVWSQRGWSQLFSIKRRYTVYTYSTVCLRLVAIGGQEDNSVCETMCSEMEESRQEEKRGD